MLGAEEEVSWSYWATKSAEGEASLPDHERACSPSSTARYGNTNPMQNCSKTHIFTHQPLVIVHGGLQVLRQISCCSYCWLRCQQFCMSFSARAHATLYSLSHWVAAEGSQWNDQMSDLNTRDRCFHDDKDLAKPKRVLLHNPTIRIVTKLQNRFIFNQWFVGSECLWPNRVFFITHRCVMEIISAGVCEQCSVQLSTKMSWGNLTQSSFCKETERDDSQTIDVKGKKSKVPLSVSRNNKDQPIWILGFYSR